MMNDKQRRLFMAIVLMAMIGALLYLTTKTDEVAMANIQITATPTVTLQPKLREFLDEAPFPRVYVLYHNGGSCISGGERSYFFDKIRYANVAELHYQLGGAKTESTWWKYRYSKIDVNDDGDCDDDGDIRVVDWLEKQWQAMSANAHGVSVPHYQLAFLPLWYFKEDEPSGFDILHKQAIDGCDTAYAFVPTPSPTSTPDSNYLSKRVWALHKAKDAADAGQVLRWNDGANLALVNVYAGTPVATSVTIRCDTRITEGLTPTETPAPRSYHEWMPLWVEARIGETRVDDDPNEINPWDGIRIDSQANLFLWAGGADFDLDGHIDTRKEENGGYNDKNDTAFGRHYLDDLYQQGVDKLFHNIYQHHAGEWLMGGNEAWYPNGSSPDDPSGFGELPNMHFTIAENWTNRWGSDGAFEFINWPDPDTGSYYPASQMTFETAVRVWDTWTHHGNGRKGFVILSKCDDPLGNKCNGLEAGNLDDSEYGWADMHREFRFSLAAALMLDAYHAFTGEGYHMAPYWYDEYAVILKDGKPVAAKAGADENGNGIDDRAEGVGWLGFPVSDPLGVFNGQVTDTTLCEALANTRQADSFTPTPTSTPVSTPRVINDFDGWIRYFEHGVAILNPSSQDITVVLDQNSTYRHIQCAKGGHSLVNAQVDCQTNDGQSIENHQVQVNAHDGLLLYGEANLTDKIAISASQYDIQYREGQELLWLSELLWGVTHKKR